MHAGGPQTHRLTPGVRVLEDGILQYDDEKAGRGA